MTIRMVATIIFQGNGFFCGSLSLMPTPVSALLLVDRCVVVAVILPDAI